MLILVRHAMPATDARTAPRCWPLGPDGIAAAGRLASTLPAPARLVASTELKARQTLEAAGPAVRQDRRFDEVARTESWEGDYRRLRREYVDGTDHPGWEPRAQVVQRFGAAVAEHLAIAGERPLVVATHGMAMTIWLTACVGLADPGAFWAGLGFPDVLEVDLAGRTVVRGRWRG